MNNSTNNSFEEQWQKAFDDASLPPTDAVWEKIELGLGNENIPPKPNNSSYYVGGAVLAVILGLGIWFFSHEKEAIKSVQVIENKEIKQEEKIENVVLEKVEKIALKPKEMQATKKVIIPKKEEVEVVPTELEIVMQEPENQTRIITDSIDFINPKISTKNMNTGFENPSIEIPFQATPYYEKPIPKPKKKSIWDKVRISGGVGIYQ
jgi:hypothetical protein